jgi:hypothetical protein
MNTFLKNLGASIRDVLTSKKFLIGVMTAVVQALPIPDDAKHSILGIGAALILGQAAADLGKNKPTTPAA